MSKQKQYTAGEFRQIAAAFEPIGVVARIHNGTVEREITAGGIKAMLIQSAKNMEREKKYEYSELYPEGRISCVHVASIMRDHEGTLIRREVGEWEYVDSSKDDCPELANDVDRLREENERLKSALRPVLEANDVDRLREENERLKSALRPVLECDRHSCDCGAEYAVKCARAVDEAHRIYNPGDPECTLSTSRAKYGRGLKC